MKICTITSHWVYNYGASLQAFALQKYLESEGNAVEIINYRPEYTKRRYNLLAFPTSGIKWKIVKYFPPAILLLWPYVILHSGMLRTWKRKNAFDEFTQAYLSLTSKEYSSLDELRKSSPEADIYIAGSDQIWNANMNNGKDPAYFLDFGKPATKRCSYAASVAMEELSEEQAVFFKDKLSKFDRISIREKSSIDLLEKIGIINITHVLDPVFLLEKGYWMDISEKAKQYSCIEERYLLLYDFLGNDPEMIKFAKKIAKERKIKIVSLVDFRGHSFADYNIRDAGPLEFLSLIRNAEVVVSSSFHATAFSIIFEKDFYVFQIKLKYVKNNSRMIDLLKQFNLENRLNPTSAINGFDINKVREIYNIRLKDSRRYISDLLSL